MRLGNIEPYEGNVNKRMSQGRRTIDRRRRILYSAQADTGPSTAASRREAARLREARSPAATYGSGVRRRLRGRWFSLVPVRRRTMAIVVGTIALVAMLLCLSHYASVAWPSIANRGDIARPLRLDRADSFGRWFAGMLMMGSAGASFLIYQLRRHRLDDFSGHYRLWRLVLIVMLLASLNSVVSLVDWSGALLDASIGKRVALAGADWIRIVVTLGGAVLALRLIAEVRHSRAALVALLAAVGCFAIPEAVKWNVLQVETIGRWAVVTSAPLLAFTSLFLSLGIYLRMLYREVRRLDQTDSLKDRFQQMRLRVFQRSDDEDSVDHEEDEEEGPRRGWFRRRRSKAVDEANAEADWEEEQETHAKAAVAQEDQQDDQEQEPKPKRRWFGLRAAKPLATDDDEALTAKNTDPPPAKTKKRRFSLRLDPAASQQTAESEPEESESSKSKRRFGLGAFRRPRAERAAAAESEAAAPGTQTGKMQGNDSADDDYIDPDTIDWNGLSKSERRRLKKQLRRQNRAA